MESKEVPSEDLLEALKEVEDMEKGEIQKKGYHNVREMFEDIMKDIKNS